jgi:hypothetical protein
MNDGEQRGGMRVGVGEPVPQQAVTNRCHAAEDLTNRDTQNETLTNHAN